MTGDSRTARLLAEARAGSREALGELLNACRGYLLVVARREIAPDLLPKGGASDLVQETFLEAQRDFARFQGDSEGELLAWLRQLLLHNIANFTRSFRQTAKRSVALEVPVEVAAGAGQALPAEVPSPSVQVAEEEETEALRRALDHLPEDYRQVVLLRYQEGHSFEEIAGRMQRSSNAVRKLWARAIERLQEDLESLH